MICFNCKVDKSPKAFADNKNGSKKKFCRACGRKMFRKNGPYKSKGKNKAWKRAVEADKKKQANAMKTVTTRFVEPGTPIGEL